MGGGGWEEEGRRHVMILFKTPSASSLLLSSSDFPSVFAPDKAYSGRGINSGSRITLTAKSRRKFSLLDPFCHCRRTCPIVPQRLVGSGGQRQISAHAPHQR